MQKPEGVRAPGTDGGARGQGGRSSRQRLHGKEYGSALSWCASVPSSMITQGARGSREQGMYLRSRLEGDPAGCE